MRHAGEIRAFIASRHRIATVFGVLLLAFPSTAAAYIDPISGSVILQVLAAGIFAGSLAFRRFRESLSKGLRSISRRVRR